MHDLNGNVVADNRDGILGLDHSRPFLLGKFFANLGGEQFGRDKQINIIDRFLSDRRPDESAGQKQFLGMFLHECDDFLRQSAQDPVQIIG